MNGLLSRRVRSLRLALAFVALIVVQALSIHGAAGQSLQLIRGPYLQQVTTDSALVCWAANAPHGATVAYGPAPALTSSAPATGVTPDHCVRLGGLAPFSRYAYQVKAGSTDLSPVYTFHTAAGPDQGPVSFIAWGDNRNGDDVHANLVSLITPLAPDFVLNVGDLVAEGRLMSQWDTFFRLEQPLLAISPLYPVLGNHEENSPLFFSLFSLPGNERWYSFDNGPMHVTALDVYFSPFGPGSAQYTWLEQDLREATRPWKVLLVHSPPYSYSEARGSGEEPVRAALVPLIEKYGVQLVVSGHNHFYQRNVINGVTYMTAGAGGAPLHAVQSGPGTIFTESVPHFVRINASATELSSVAVRQDGSQFDPFTLRRPGSGAGTPLPTTPGAGTPVGGPTASATPVGGVTLPPPAAPGLLDQFTCRRCHLEFPLTSWTAAQDGLKEHGTVLLGLLSVLAALLLAIRLAFSALRSRRKGTLRHGA